MKLIFLIKSFEVGNWPEWNKLENMLAFSIHKNSTVHGMIASFYNEVTKNYHIDNNTSWKPITIKKL